MQDKLSGAKEISNHLRISERTLTNRINSYANCPVKKEGGQLVCSKMELDIWSESIRVNPNIAKISNLLLLLFNKIEDLEKKLENIIETHSSAKTGKYQKNK